VKTAREAAKPKIGVVITYPILEAQANAAM
jgi:hypothetical protein